MKITSAAPYKSNDVDYLFRVAVFTDERTYVSKLELHYQEANALVKEVRAAGTLDERFIKFTDFCLTFK